MPSVEELLKRSEKKKFVKKDRRPWDYDISISDDSNESHVKKAPMLNKALENSREQEYFRVPNQKVELKQEDKKVTNKVTEKVTYEVTPIVELEVKQDILKPTVHNNSFEYSLNISRAILTKREIQSLVGLQKKLFFTIFNTCVKEGALSTITFSTKDFEEITQSSCETVKTSLNRLFKKALLLRLDGKRAKGGYLYIGFDKEVWDICMQMVNEDRTLIE